METKENIIEESLQEMKNTVAERTANYQQDPPIDPEDESFEEDEEEDFPAKEDLEDDDFDLNPDDDDLDFDIDDEDELD